MLGAVKYGQKIPFAMLRNSNLAGGTVPNPSAGRACTEVSTREHMALVVRCLEGLGWLMREDGQPRKLLCCSSGRRVPSRETIGAARHVLRATLQTV